MKQLLALVAICSALASFSFGQSPRTIQWKNGMIDGNKIEGFESYVEGNHVRAIAVDNMIIGAVIADGKKTFNVLVVIVNYNPQSVNVLPEAFVLEEMGEKPKRMKFIPHQALANKLERDARRDAMWMMLGAAMMKSSSSTQSTTNGTVSGQIGQVPVSGIYTENTQSTTTQRDPRYIDFAARKGEQRIANATTSAEELRRTALKANTLSQGQDIMGFIYFERKKTSKGLLLRLPFGEYILEIPYNK